MAIFAAGGPLEAAKGFISPISFERERKRTTAASDGDA